MPSDLLGELIPTGGGDPIPLRRSPLVVGRSSRCDVVLPFDNVSGKHCELTLKDGYWHVADLGSRNGIRVDGNRCMESALPPGSRLRIAKHDYELAYVAAGDGPVPEVMGGSQFGGSLMQLAGLEKPERPPAERTERARPKTYAPTDLPAGDDEEEDEALRMLLGNDDD
ncbi:FHA domain-containing protein [Alienimonas californiensis]|uniref:FHA domain-containing protein FhaB n=1 Tax=Alienimonas californiensis TaxID=2527989 RepID=A0A517PDQ6_9PLAN|nr:FHA domain-containing protein [Alienimonas californiensis]QDT17461.1 FHA domain-containing protein FhaB [Alienimonas californiensis]